MIDPFELFKPDPKQDRRILDTVEPSDFFPKRGDYFRVRFATIASRSYIGDIWECIQSQSGCAVGRKVLDTYHSEREIGTVVSFVVGDVIFYDCSEIWAAVLDKGKETSNG